MAQPKIEILLSLVKSEAEKQAKELGTSITNTMDNVASKLVSAELFKQMFGKATQYATAFFENAVKNSENLKLAIGQLDRTWDQVGRRFGDALAQSNDFQHILDNVNQRLQEFGAWASDSSGGGGSVISFFSRLSDLTFRVGDSVANLVEKMRGLDVKKMAGGGGRTFEQQLSDLEQRQPALIPVFDEEGIARQRKAARDKAAEQAQAGRERRTSETGRLIASGAITIPEEFGGGFQAGDQGDPLKVQRERMESQAEMSKEKAEILETQRKQELASLKEHQARTKKLRDDERIKFQQDNAAWIGLAQQGSSGLANGMASIVAASVSGQQSLGDAAKQAAGGLLTTIGQTLIQLGTAATLAGTLGTVIPLFAAPTGGPVGVAAGVAAIAGGVALVAAGAALGGSGSGGRQSVAGPAGVASRANLGFAAQDFNAGLERPATPFDIARPQQGLGFTPQDASGKGTVYNINFSQGFIVGSPARVAREIQAAMSGPGLAPT